MENRMLINGVWYVKETTSAPSSKSITELADIKSEVNEECMFTESCTFENSEYCWEATRLIKKNRALGTSRYYDDIDISFTDKTKAGWHSKRSEHWDYNDWFLGVLANDEDSLMHARESMKESGIVYFQAFLEKLKNIGWLVAPTKS